MRWVPWALGVVGVLQYAVIAYLEPNDYVSVDMAYLVMWLALIGGVLAGYLSCGWDCGCGCDCDHCAECSSGGCCGTCECCGPAGNGVEHSHG